MKAKDKIAERNELRKQLVLQVDAGQISLGRALVMARAIVDKNQADFAKIVGVSKKVIADLERGRGNPTVETINKLFAPVGLSVGLRSRRIK